MPFRAVLFPFGSRICGGRVPVKTRSLAGLLTTDLLIVTLVLWNDQRRRKPIYCRRSRGCRHPGIERFVRKKFDTPGSLSLSIADVLQESVRAVGDQLRHTPHSG